MQLKIQKKLFPILFGFIFWFLNPPDGLTQEGYQIFIVFISIIFSLILRAIPMAVTVLVGLCFSVLVKLLSLKEVLIGFGDSTTWLVVIAFLISGVIIESGLGKRISMVCIKIVGKSMVSMGYGICLSEFILGPVVPSNTARGGGILAPIINSMSRTLGSMPKRTPELAGEYLHLVGAHANLITAAMFLTGMAANPLISKAAQDIFQIDFDWFEWALGSIVPGVMGLAGLPLLIRYLSPPKISNVDSIRQKVQNDLDDLGSWSSSEVRLSIILIFMLILWSTKPIHGWGTTTVALFGLIVILFSGVSTWENMVKNHLAWDTLIWLGGLLTLATSLKNLGFISWISSEMQQGLGSLTPFYTILTLALIYFYSMYFFSMLTAHIIAFSSGIFIIASGFEANPFLIVPIVAYLSSLCGCLTNYSTGPIIIYFGNGYSSPIKWFKVGAIVSIYHLLVWLGVGSLWWKIIGWW